MQGVKTVGKILPFAVALSLMADRAEYIFCTSYKAVPTALFLTY
jgi:hypothetical protein